MYSAIISKSQLRNVFEEFTVALTATCLNSEADGFGKCLSAAGSHEYFCCTEKQQAVSHRTQSCRLLDSTVKVSHRKSVCAFVPHTRLLSPSQLWQWLLLSPKQICKFTETKGYMIWFLLVCCTGKMITFCFSFTCLSSCSVSLFLCNLDEIRRMQIKIVHRKKI